MENLSTHETRSSLSQGLEELEKSTKRLTQKVSRAETLHGDAGQIGIQSPHADNPQALMADVLSVNQASGHVVAVHDGDSTDATKPATYKIGRQSV